jgi:hypothetical protein
MAYYNITNGEGIADFNAASLTRPVAANETIEMGQLMKLVDNEWVGAEAADAGSATVAGPALYHAFHPSTDAQAIQAGFPNGTAVIRGFGTVPTKIIETDMFVDGQTYTDNVTNLTVANDGKYTPAGNGNTVYGQVVKGPWTKAVNGHAPVGASAYYKGTGHARLSVITVRTVYIPQVATA